MNRYADRLDRIEADLQATAKWGNQQIDISKYFEHCARKFNAGEHFLSMNPKLKVDARFTSITDKTPRDY